MRWYSFFIVIFFLFGIFTLQQLQLKYAFWYTVEKLFVLIKRGIFPFFIWSVLNGRLYLWLYWSKFQCLATPYYLILSIHVGVELAGPPILKTAIHLDSQNHKLFFKI